MARYLILACALFLVSAALAEENSDNPNNMNHNNMNPNMNHMNPNNMNPMNHNMNPNNMNPNNMNPNNQNMKPPGDLGKQHSHNNTKSQDLPKLPEKAETNSANIGKN